MLDKTAILTVVYTAFTHTHTYICIYIPTHKHAAQPGLKVNSSTGRIAYHLSHLTRRGMTSQTSQRRRENDREKRRTDGQMEEGRETRDELLPGKVQIEMPDS